MMHIEKLRDLAESNQTAHDMFVNFALRQRARGQITVAALHQKMHREGFNHSRQDYAVVLVRLQELGIGELVRSSRGRLIGINKISIKLQDLGRAVIEDQGSVRNHAPRSRYSPVPLTASPPIPPVAPTPTVPGPLTRMATLIGAILDERSIAAESRIKAVQYLLGSDD